METCLSKGQARSPAGLGRAVVGAAAGRPLKLGSFRRLPLAPGGLWKVPRGQPHLSLRWWRTEEGPPRVAGHATASAPSSARRPHQERPGGPLCLPRTRVYRPSDGSPEGQAQDRLGQPCVSPGRRDESPASPPEWTRGLPPRGKSTARLERKTKENQRRSRPRGAAEGPALSRIPVPVPLSTAWAAVELGPATTSLRSVAFSPPHVGSLFIFYFF